MDFDDPSGPQKWYHRFCINPESGSDGKSEPIINPLFKSIAPQNTCFLKIASMFFKVLLCMH